MEKQLVGILIIGSRTCTPAKYGEQVFDSIDRYIKKEGIKTPYIISGGAIGADEIAKQYAHENGYPFMQMDANWEKYGRSAGHIRNEWMIDVLSLFDKKYCLAFWDGESKGTKGSIDNLKGRHITTRVYRTWYE